MNSENHHPSGWNGERAPVGTVTLITAKCPERLAKRYRMDEAGMLHKDGAGQLAEGFAEVVSVPTVEAFTELLGRLTGGQALTYGLPIAELLTSPH